MISSSELHRMNTTAKFRTDVPSYEVLTEPSQTPDRGASRSFAIRARSLYIALAFATLTWVAPCQEISGIEPTQPGPRINAEHSDTSEHQTRLNGVLPKYNDPVICTYDLSTFGANVAIDIIRTYPVVIIGAVLQENPFFVPKEGGAYRLARITSETRPNQSAEITVRIDGDEQIYVVGVDRKW